MWLPEGAVTLALFTSMAGAIGAIRIGLADKYQCGAVNFCKFI
jgi:hypothetical protein